MKRLWRETLTGATIGIAWGIAARFIPRWLYLAITTAALVAIIVWCRRSLRELRVMQRELKQSTAALGKQWGEVAEPPSQAKKPNPCGLTHDGPCNPCCNPYDY